MEKITDQMGAHRRIVVDDEHFHNYNKIRLLCAVTAHCL